jgi:hypothetical protein
MRRIGQQKKKRKNKQYAIIYYVYAPCVFNRQRSED